LGDGGPATSAGMTPFGAGVDSSGNLYVADTGNARVREVVNGIINTIAGGGNGECYNGYSGSATGVSLDNPAALAVVGSTIYFADANCVYKLTAAATGPPSINPGGVVSASQFGEFPAAAPGSFVEIYGSNLAAISEQWSSSNFTGVNAPTSLDQTSVSIGGQSAFISYISPGQVNAQIPSNVATGMQPLIVTTPSGSSSTYQLMVNEVEPGFLAPPSFNVNGTQYVAAFSSDFSSYALPTGAIQGINSKPPSPGLTIILYGIGFGAVTPNIPAGQIAQQQNTLTNTFSISIGGLPAQVEYAGLAPNYVGLYQFNIVVPQVAVGNAVPVTFTLAGSSGTQTLYIAVQ
jgi:uncharacterized protein (TIGR03437 family)